MLKLNPLVPELIVSDLSRSLAFYCGVLGFRIEYERPEEHFAFLSFGGSQLMLEQDWQSESPWRVGPLEAPYGRGINLSSNALMQAQWWRRWRMRAMPSETRLKSAGTAKGACWWGSAISWCRTRTGTCFGLLKISA